MKKAPCAFCYMGIGTMCESYTIVTPCVIYKAPCAKRKKFKQ